MPVATWLRALAALGTVAEATRAFREARGAAAARSAPSAPAHRPAPPGPAPPETVSGLETRLANVVVAALREAFERDRARFDRERDFHEIEHATKERALRLEWLRQTSGQTLDLSRHLAALAIFVWLFSAAAAVWLGDIGVGAKVLLGLGWVGLVATAATAFFTHQRVTRWLAEQAYGPESVEPAQPRLSGQPAVPWLFAVGVLLTAAGLLVQL